jgi:hypothetical protein
VRKCARRKTARIKDDPKSECVIKRFFFLPLTTMAAFPDHDIASQIIIYLYLDDSISLLSVSTSFL